MTGVDNITLFGINPTSVSYRPGANNQVLNAIPLPAAWRPGITPGTAQKIRVKTDKEGYISAIKVLPDNSKMYAGIVLGVLSLVLIFLIIRKMKRSK